jgi:hypothetical protein
MEKIPRILGVGGFFWVGEFLYNLAVKALLASDATNAGINSFYYKDRIPELGVGFDEFEWAEELLLLLVTGSIRISSTGFPCDLDFEEEELLLSIYYIIYLQYYYKLFLNAH